MTQPPGKAAHTNLQIGTIRRGTKYYRISKGHFPDPLHFGIDNWGRYNSHSGAFGVCYIAESLETAFTESLGRKIAERFTPTSAKIIPSSDLDIHHAYEIEIVETLHVAELNGSGLPRLNLDNSINTSKEPYTVPQQWSDWVHNHPKQLDGIRYQSRHLSTNRCLAVYDRSKTKLTSLDLGALSTCESVWDILDNHGWGIV